MSEKDSGDRRRRLDSVIPELIKRAVEIGVEKAAEAPDNLKEFVGGMKLPREAANYLLAQVEETKNGLFRVVAKEVREFLEHTNLAGENGGFEFMKGERAAMARLGRAVSVARWIELAEEMRREFALVEAVNLDRRQVWISSLLGVQRLVAA